MISCHKNSHPQPWLNDFQGGFRHKGAGFCKISKAILLKTRRGGEASKIGSYLLHICGETALPSA
jgi:hypothetical protein